MSPRPKPYEWPRRAGVLHAWQLRNYATWLLPQIGRRWQAEGVTDFTQKSADASLAIEPYNFPKSRGVILRPHLIHFAAFVFRVLKPESDRVPYQWPRRHGIAMVQDLQKLDAHIISLIAKRREKN